MPPMNGCNMMETLRRGVGVIALGAASVIGAYALAQDETTPAVEEGAEAEDTVAPAAPVKARPAEMSMLASRSLLLGVANNGKHLVAVGDRGNIVASNDGVNWAQVEVPVRATLTAVEFVDENNGWAVGHDAVILHTGDSGRTWVLQNFEPELEKPFLDVLFVDGNRGMAVGAYGLFMATSDGGANWAEVDAPAIREDELHLNSIARLANGDFFVVGESGTMGVSADGNTWTRVKAPYEGSLYGALPRGDKGVVVFGLRGNVYTTADVRGGQWNKVEMGTVASFFGATALPNGDIVMVGLAGEIAFLSASGKVRNAKLDAMAGVTGSGTLSGAIPWKGGVIAVGELGVSTVGL
ncbi:MAG: WD40/YVTN/BNR-like repeat-containing protein [Panacagrimonas sp.]